MMQTELWHFWAGIKPLGVREKADIGERVSAANKWLSSPQLPSLVAKQDAKAVYIMSEYGGDRKSVV